MELQLRGCRSYPGASSPASGVKHKPGVESQWCSWDSEPAQGHLLGRGTWGSVAVPCPYCQLGWDCGKVCVGGQVSLAPIGMGVTAHGDTKVMTGTDFVSLSTALGWSENQKQLLAGGRGKLRSWS